MAIYLFFKSGGRSPSWICYTHIGLHMKNIGGLYSFAKIWLKCKQQLRRYGSLNNLRICLENACSRHYFSGLNPK